MLLFPSPYFSAGFGLMVRPFDTYAYLWGAPLLITMAYGVTPFVHAGSGSGRNALSTRFHGSC